jgi:hypothetical protein
MWYKQCQQWSTPVEYDEFKRRLGKAGLSLKEFAGLVRVTETSVSNYASRGAVPCHFAVAVTLMAEMADRGLDFRDPLKSLNVEPRRQTDPDRASGFGRARQYKIQLSSHEHSESAADLR